MKEVTLKVFKLTATHSEKGPLGLSMDVDMELKIKGNNTIILDGKLFPHRIMGPSSGKDSYKVESLHETKFYSQDEEFAYEFIIGPEKIFACIAHRGEYNVDAIKEALK